MLKKQYMIYCCFPYTEDPALRTEQINKIARDIYETTLPNGNDLILLIPHNVFDRVFDFPIGNSNAWMLQCEYNLIAKCDAVAYHPKFVSTGVTWELEFAKAIEKPIFTYEQLKAGARP